MTSVIVASKPSRAGSRWLAALVLAAVLVLPASASAAVIQAPNTAAFYTALATAAGTPADDQIVLGSGTYTGPFSYSADAMKGKVEIIGAGTGQTTLRSAGSYAFSFDAGSAAGSRIANLRIDQTGGPNADDLRVGAPGAIVEDVTLTNSGAGVGNVGVIVTAPSVTIRRVTADGVFKRAFAVQAAGAALTDVTARNLGSSATAIEVGATGVSGATGVVQHARVTGGLEGAAAKFGGTLTVTDSLIDVRGVANARALLAGDSDPGAFTSSVTGDRVTIIGDATTTAAVSVVAGGADEADVISATLRDSIVSGITTPLVCAESGSVPQATITVANADLPAAVTNTCVDLPDTGITATGTTAATPGFINPASDFRLRWDSPLRDLGGAAPAGGVPDLGGLPRIVDGDGNGSAIVDLGAYEYQRIAPVISTATATPLAPAIGQAVAFSATATDADPLEGAALAYTWTFDDGGTGSGLATSHTFLTVGTHTATVTVTDPVGLAVGTQVVVKVGIPAPGPTAQPGPGEKPVPLPPPVPKPDKTAPSLKAITLARSFTFARTLPGVVTPKRAQLRLTLSEAATLSLTFERRSGKGYKKVVGVVTLKAKAGAAGVRFTGALSAKKRLTPGVYRLTIVATDAAGNRSKPKQFTFRLKR